MKSLCELIEEGNFDSVIKQINDGADIDVKCGRQKKPLIVYAIENEIITLAKLLFEKGVDVNMKTGFMSSPLVLDAVVEGKGYTEIVKLLIEKGADINSSDKYGNTPLQRMILFGNDESVMTLIECGAEIDQKTLSHAAEKGSLDLVKLLLDKGAKGKGLALASAAKDGHLNIVKFFLDEGVNINWQEEKIAKDGTATGTVENTALHNASSYLPTEDAVIRKKLETVRYLLENGAEVNRKGSDGNTALHLAADDENLEIVKLLLENGADKKAKNDDEERPFKFVDKDQKIVKALIK